MSTSPRLYACIGLLGTLFCLPAFAAQTAATTASQSATTARQSATTTVILETGVGSIHIALDTARAPQTAQNFLAYVDSGRFNGIQFYRAMTTRRDGSEGIIQGGYRNNLRGALPPVVHESTVTTGLSHVDGAVSMAYTSNPGSARTEFFIVIGGIPSYDGVPGGAPGYAVFGKVSKGMSVVRKILGMPKSPNASNPNLSGQMLVEPVTVVTAKRAP